MTSTQYWKYAMRKMHLMIWKDGFKYTSNLAQMIKGHCLKLLIRAKNTKSSNLLLLPPNLTQPHWLSSRFEKELRTQKYAALIQTASCIPQSSTQLPRPVLGRPYNRTQKYTGTTITTVPKVLLLQLASQKWEKPIELNDKTPPSCHNKPFGQILYIGLS